MVDNTQVAESPVEEPGSTGVTIQLPEGVEPKLDELFNRNPLEWEEEDLDKVIQHMRASRHLFKKGIEEGKKGAGTTKAKASARGRKALKEPSSALSLKDLGLDL